MNPTKFSHFEKWYKRYSKDVVIRKENRETDLDNGRIPKDNSIEEIRADCLKNTKERYFKIRDFEIIVTEWDNEWNEKNADWLKKQGRNVKPPVEKGWYFLSLRPHPSLPFDKFKALVEKFFKKKYFKEGRYVWEQIGETPETLGEGFHIHAKYRVSSPSKGFSHYLKDIHKFIADEGLKDYIADNCVKLSEIRTTEYDENTDAYFNPETFGKTDENKEVAWNLNAKWRETKGLQDLYLLGKNNNTTDIVRELTNHEKVCITLYPELYQYLKD